MLSESVYSSVKEAIQFLKDASEDLGEADVKETLSAVRSYLDGGRTTEKILGYLVDLLIGLLQLVDIQQMSVRELTNIVGSPDQLVLLNAARGSLTPKNLARLETLEHMLFSSPLAEDFYTTFLEKDFADGYLSKIYQIGIKDRTDLSENFVETVNSLYQNNFKASQLKELVTDLRSNGYDLRSRRGSRRETPQAVELKEMHGDPDVSDFLDFPIEDQEADPNDCDSQETL